MEKNMDLKKKRIKPNAFLVLGIWISACSTAVACDACKQQQPKILQGITHGAGPTSNWDYIIVGIMVLITLYSLYALIKCLAKPESHEYQDIKKIIFSS